MRHHEERGRVEALDEETALVIERGIGWTTDRGHPLGVEPVPGGSEQPPSRRGVVVALEKTEKPTVLSVALDMPGVDDAGDPPDIDPAARGNEAPRLRPLVEGMGAEVEELLLGHDQGGHPAGVFAVDPPGKTDETLLFRPGVHRPNGQFRHGSSMPIGSLECRQPAGATMPPELRRSAGNRRPARTTCRTGHLRGEASYPSTAAPPPVTEVFPFFFRTTMEKVRNMDRPRRPFHTEFR